MKVQKLFTRIVAFTLCIVMLACSVKMDAFAYDQRAGEPNKTKEQEEQELAQSLGEDILCEDVTKREEHVKHFIMNDGTRVAATYEDSVHYQDDDGTWKEYDNRLEDNVIGTEVHNKTNENHIRISKKAKKHKMVQMETGDYAISWGYEGTNKSILQILDSDETEQSGNGKMTVKNLRAHVMYPELYSNTDLEITICGSRLKENLIVKNADGLQTYHINYHIGDLQAEQTDNQTILLKNEEGEIVYTIRAPYMYDADATISNALSLNMKEKGQKLIVEIIPDMDWLLSKDRVYPVTIDPYIETQQTTNAIESATLCSNTIEAGTYPYGSLYVGRDSYAYGRMVSVVKTQLPTLGAGDMVVEAQLALRQKGYSGNTDVQVNVSKITSSWNQSDYVYSGTITGKYNTKPSGDSLIVDFVKANGATKEQGLAGTLTLWDITSITKDWYAGEPNQGVMLWANEEDTYSYATYVRADDYGSYTNVSYPVIYVSYVNNNGLEDYWGYHGFGVTNSGMAYVNDYTGNLVVTEQVFETTGARMPMNLSLVYNLRNYNTKYEYGASVGYGFMFNFQKRVAEITDTGLRNKGYKYRYTDGDGTCHYFRQKENSTTEWVDESGLGLTLKETGDSGAGIYIHHKNGAVEHYYSKEYGGVLFFEKDAFGNKIRYYSSVTHGEEYGRVITSIVDGAGRMATINYEVMNGILQVKQITDNENRTYQFAYHDSDKCLLSSITYPDGRKTNYSFSNRRLCRIDDSLGKKTWFSFQGTGDITKTQIQKVTTYAVNNDVDSLEEEITFEYHKDNTTIVRNLDGKEQVHQFDNYGRTTSVQYPDGSIDTCQYTTYANGTTSGNQASASAINNHKLAGAGSTEKYVKNYISNSNAERQNAFYNSSWDGTEQVTQSYDTAQAYLGLQSLKVQHSQEGMIFSCYGQQIYTTDFSDSEFTFSAYVKTENVVPSGPHGAGLIVVFYDNTGTTLNVVHSNYYVKGTTDWTRIGVSGHAPAGAAEVRVYCGLRGALGTAWFDCLQLEKSIVMNDYNLVENSDFSKTDIWGKNAFASGDSLTGNGEVCIVGQSTGNKFIYQFMNVNKADVCFNLFGTMEGAQAAAKSGRLCGLEIYLRYKDGTSEYHTKSFNPSTTTLQSISHAIKPRQTGKIVKDIGVYYIVRNNANTTRLKNIMVSMEETGTSYSYDSKGNLIRSGDHAARNQSYEYNEANELTKQVTAQNETYQYIYNSNNKHQLEAARSKQLGNGYRYTYDQYGNVIQTQMGMVSEEGVLDTDREKISASMEYNTAANYIRTQTDVRGKVTTYDVNDANGLVHSVSMPATIEGQSGTATVLYTYDESTRQLKTVTASESNVKYNYDEKRRLSTIQYDNESYGFSYDSFGNLITTRVGNSLLCRNEYSNARKGLIGSVIYGNEDRVEYTYDSLDRLISKSVNGQAKLRKHYNDKGLVARSEDILNGNTTDYVYDMTGRLIRSHVYGERSAGTKYKYDSMDRITELIPSVGDEYIENIYTYGSDNLLSHMYQGVLYYTYTYDHLNRVETETVRFQGGNELKNEYDYYTGTSLVSAKRRYCNNVLEETYTYSYDNSGNISAIQKDGQLLESYTYDALQQLKTVTTGNETYEYEYDTRGNLLSVKLNGSTIHTYTYSDAEWKDKLTAYNGQSITYDAIGNPLTYRNGMQMQWEEGRQLCALQTQEKELLYKYDESGQRIRKTVNGTSINYYYDDLGNLYRAGDGTDAIWFFYSPDGSVMSFKYRYARYYYVKNVQGDIIGIADSSGNVIVNYTYNGWGKLMTITDANGNDVTGDSANIGIINPLRYRGYYYDAETGFYYVSSRYYDPEIGRFLNADAISLLGANKDFASLNLFVYCGNNPIIRRDATGTVWETVFDVVSLGFSIAEVAMNPYDIGAWIGLVGDTVDLIPFVTGVGEVARGIRFIDKAGNALEIAKAVDFTDDATDTIKTLKRTGEFTRSTKIDGLRIHKGYKKGPNFIPDYKEYKKANGIRPDYYDGKTIFELKPFNQNSAKLGVRQLRKYNSRLGGGKIMRLEFY